MRLCLGVISSPAPAFAGPGVMLRPTGDNYTSARISIPISLKSKKRCAGAHLSNSILISLCGSYSFLLSRLGLLSTSVLLLLDTCTLTAAFTQVVKLGTLNTAALVKHDRLDIRRVKREQTL